MIVCLGVGYYAWQQQNVSLKRLEKLQQQGVSIDYYLRSRPLFAVDRYHQQILLVYSDQTINIRWSDIVEIRFVESPERHKDTSETRQPDFIEITLHDDQHYRVGDLRTQARESFEQFQTIAPKVKAVLKKR